MLFTPQTLQENALFKSIFYEVQSFFDSDQQAKKLLIIISEENSDEYRNINEKVIISIQSYIEDEFGDEYKYDKQVYLISPETKINEKIDEQPRKLINNCLTFIDRVKFTDNQTLIQEFINELMLNQKFIFLFDQESIHYLKENVYQDYQITFGRVFNIIDKMLYFKIHGLTENKMQQVQYFQNCYQIDYQNQNHIQLGWKAVSAVRQFYLGVALFTVFYSYMINHRLTNYCINDQINRKVDLDKIEQNLDQNLDPEQKQQQTKQINQNIVNLLYKKTNFQQYLPENFEFIKSRISLCNFIELIIKIFRRVQYSQDKYQTEEITFDLLEETQLKRLQNMKIQINKGVSGMNNCAFSNFINHFKREIILEIKDIYIRLIQKNYTYLIGLDVLTINLSAIKKYLNPDLTAINHKFLSKEYLFKSSKFYYCRQFLYVTINQFKQWNIYDLFNIFYQHVFHQLDWMNQPQIIQCFKYWIEYFIMIGFLVEGKFTSIYVKTYYPKEKYKLIRECENMLY